MLKLKEEKELTADDYAICSERFPELMKFRIDRSSSCLNYFIIRVRVSKEQV